jgi:hypothetical protein
MTNNLKIEVKPLRKTQLKVGFLLQNIFSLDSKIVCKKGDEASSSLSLSLSHRPLVGMAALLR